MATHSSILAWRTPGTEESCGLQSLGSQSLAAKSLVAKICLETYFQTISYQGLRTQNAFINKYCI